MQTLLEAFTAYATEHSDKEPQLLAQLRRETHQKVLQPRMLSGPLQGRLLSLLAQITVPKRILEVGTFTGYATLCLAEGLPPEGVIDTIDCNEEIVAFQNSFFEKSPYRKQIHQHLLKYHCHIKIMTKYLKTLRLNYIHYYCSHLPTFIQSHPFLI